MPASSPACTPSSTITEDEYDRTMLVNFKSVWLGSKFAIRQMLPQDRSTGHGDASSTSPRSEAWSARGRARLLRRQGRGGEPDPPACRRLRRRTHQRQRLIPVLGLCPVAVPVVRGPTCRRRRPKLPLQPSPTASGAWSPQWAATNDEPPRTASTRPLGDH